MSESVFEGRGEGWYPDAHYDIVLQYVFNYYLSKIKCERPEVNNESTHFLTFMNNNKEFSSLDGMACSY